MVAAGKKKLKAAVIGLGMGRGHIRQFIQSGRAEVAAVCDLDAARCESVRAALAKDNLPHDWAFFNDYRKLLKEIKPDVVSVALPNFLHAPVTLDALRAGAHVLCEKPPAMNVREAVAMEKEARKRGRALSFNLSYRAAPASLLLKKWTDENRLGPIYHARTIWHRQRGIPKGTGWFFDAKRAGGGPLIDLGVHRIDLAWWLMGEPEPATVSAATFRKFGPKVHGPQYTVEDFGSGFVRFKDGRTLSLEISWHSFCEKKETMSTELFGEKGGAVQRNTPAGGYEFECLLFQEMGGERVEVKPSALPKPGPEDNAAAQLCRFIQDGTPLSISARSGVCLQRILDGLYASAKIGREVKA